MRLWSLLLDGREGDETSVSCSLPSTASFVFLRFPPCAGFDGGCAGPAIPKSRESFDEGLVTSRDLFFRGGDAVVETGDDMVSMRGVRCLDR